MVMTIFASTSNIAGESDVIKVPQLLENMVKEGAIISESWSVDDTLNGFALTVGTDRLIVFGTADGRYVINGSVLDQNANDLTRKFAEKYMPKPQMDSFVSLIRDSKHIQSKEPVDGREIFVFHDPNCGYCRRAHSTILENLQIAKTGINWIPVAALGQDSLEKSSVLLKSQNPTKLQQDFNRGYTPSATEVQDAAANQQAVIDNTRLMKQIGVAGTPAFVVFQDGKIVELIKGFRRDQLLTAMGL
jgi:thiol:disulfide interchange protein DsbG